MNERTVLIEINLWNVKHEESGRQVKNSDLLYNFNLIENVLSKIELKSRNEKIKIRFS